jgi:hydroxyacylglutathione hydrolase
MEGYQVVRGVDRCVFTGDTIFVGGCGRFFEGSAAEMVYAMSVVRDRIPQDTKMFCGHEYSEQNMNFCKLADPTNPVVAAKAAENAALLSAGWFSVPTTIS